MKTKILLTALIGITFLSSCDLIKKDDGSLKGDQSPMGLVGETASSSSTTIAGVSGFSATVSSLTDGVSTFSGSATVNNTVLKNLLSNFPELTISGNTVSANNLKFKLTKEGIEFKSGARAGIWVKYGSSIGDTYPIGSTGDVRTVVSKSSTDDYSYGFWLIKTIQVEESNTFLTNAGIKKVTYIANHKFGLVGLKFTFNDNTEASFPLYFSKEN